MNAPGNALFIFFIKCVDSLALQLQSNVKENGNRKKMEVEEKMEWKKMVRLCRTIRKTKQTVWEDGKLEGSL